MLHKVAFILLVIGGLNVGLAAVGFNVLDMILGSFGVVATVVYVLIGLSAIYEVVTHKGNCKQCSSGGSAPTAVTHG